MKQDYARTVGYLALLILFIQMLPFGPLFRVIATAVCCFILIGIAFSISNFTQRDSSGVETKKVPEARRERVMQEQVQQEVSETQPEPENILVIEEFEVETPLEHYEEREQ